MKFNSIVFMLLLALAVPCWAGTYTAASCNQSDVNAVINGPTHTAVDGDTIMIPAGSCTWTASLAITKNITIQGAGSPNSTASTFGAGSLGTVITDNIASNPLFTAQISYSSGALFRLSTVDIEPGSSSTALASPIQIAGTCTSSECPNIRIDNIGFGLTTQWSESGNGAQAETMIRVDNVFGVLDHNTLPSGSGSSFANVGDSAYLGVGGWGDNSWAQPDTWGSANLLYMENNVLYSSQWIVDDEFPPVGGSEGGGRYAGRFNHVVCQGCLGIWSAHGLDTSGRPRSMRQIEAYGNTIGCTTSGCNMITSGRGGTNITFGNTATAASGTWWNTVEGPNIYRNVYAPSYWNYCGGLNSLDPWDTIDNTVYYTGTMTTSGSGVLTMTDTSKSWTTNQLAPSGAPYSVYDTTQGFVSEVASNTSDTITVQSPISESGWTGFNNGDSYEIIRATVCVDQFGRGQGNYVSGTTPSPATAMNEALDPTYEWDDTVASLLHGNIGPGGTARIIANRDWYTDGSNGAPQAQTSPTSPFNGSSGVGFGSLANRPTTCTKGVGYFATDQGNWNTSGNGFGQGELFVCTATNTWSLYYTPYAYPHPLAQGTAKVTPAPPTGTTGTVQQLP